MAGTASTTVRPNEDDYLDHSTEDDGLGFVANLKLNENTTMHPDAIQTVTSSLGITMAIVAMALGVLLVIGIFATGIICGIIRCRRRRTKRASREDESALPKPEDKLLNTHDSNHNQDTNEVDGHQHTRMLTDTIPRSLHETSF